MSKLLYIGGGVALGIGGLVVYHRYRHPLAEGYAALPTNATLPAGAALGRASLQVSPDHRVELRKKDAERVLVALGNKSVKDDHMENIWGGQAVEYKRLESPPDAWLETAKVPAAASGLVAPPFPLIAGVHANLVDGLPKAGSPSAAKVAITAAGNGWDVYVSLDEKELIIQCPACPDPTVKLGCALLVKGDPAKKPIPALPMTTVPVAALPERPTNAPPAAPAPGQPNAPAVAGYRTWRRWRDMQPGL